MSLNEKVANRILYYCDSRGITVNKLATLAGLTQSTIDSILKGKTKSPSIITVSRICFGLKITLKDFFDSTEFNEFDEF